MSKIVVSGYYGFDNAGDEAVLYSIVQALRATSRKTLEITVLSNNPVATAQTFDVKSENRWRILDVIRAIKGSDLLISGGGSLLQDVTSKRSMLYYLGVVTIAKIFRKPVIFYAQGIGPVNGAFNQKMLKWVGNGVNHIFVRDTGSKDLLGAIGVSRPPIEVVMDPVVGMTLTETQWHAPDQILDGEGVPESKPLVGIYLRHWKNAETLTPAFANVVNWMGERGWHPVFVPMHFPDDVDAGEEVGKLLTVPYTMLKGHYSPQDILALTAHFDFAIAMRLHGLIMAANAKTPFMGISYDPKIDAFVKATGHGTVFSSEAFDAQACIAYLTKVLPALSEEREHLKSLEETFMTKAYAPAKHVCELLKVI